MAPGILRTGTNGDVIFYIPVFLNSFDGCSSWVQMFFPTFLSHSESGFFLNPNKTTGHYKKKA